VPLRREPVRVESGQRLIECGPLASWPGVLARKAGSAGKGEKWARRERPE